ncbi:MAG: MFS transporter [Candidatus Bathyarchaeota archaeon]|nr:MFS transporter [Candidatus Bathyarchaeota archaeon]
MEYKWIALSNTTIGVLMASIDTSIVLIALPAIFRGINIDPFGSFQYLLWIMFGYSIVTATLLVTFGRLSDIYGRVKLYNLGFLIFTIGSILLFLTPSTGDAGAIELIVFRIIQGVGAAFLFSNSGAIITDAFPENERGKALGINQLAFLVGSLIGLVLGGVLAVFDWRLVFLVSVPVGIIGTAWSYWKLKEQHVVQRKKQKIDLWGNLSFGGGLTLLLLAITYGLTPYGDSPMGWGNPLVIASFAAGAALLIAFPFIEQKVQDPMFRIDLFKNRNFAAGNAATFLSSMARGGVMIMLIVLLQGIWLPLQGYSFEDAPFWAGIFMIPMTIGVALTGPVSGWLSDKHGARTLATAGMVITGVSFLAFVFMPANFAYLPFAIILFIMGIGNGIFMSPNMASVMNSCPAEHRGAASGMRSTLQNCGQTISQAVFFSIIIISLNATLPGALSSAVAAAGASSELAAAFSQVPAAGALFAAFLGYNPIGTLLQAMGPIAANIPQSTLATLTGTTFFPTTIADPFMHALTLAFIIGAILCFLAGIFSAVWGKNPKTASKPKTTAPSTKA